MIEYVTTQHTVDHQMSVSGSLCPEVKLKGYAFFMKGMIWVLSRAESLQMLTAGMPFSLNLNFQILWRWQDSLNYVCTLNVMNFQFQIYFAFFYRNCNWIFSVSDSLYFNDGEGSLINLQKEHTQDVPPQLLVLKSLSAEIQKNVMFFHFQSPAFRSTFANTPPPLPKLYALSFACFPLCKLSEFVINYCYVLNYFTVKGTRTLNYFTFALTSISANLLLHCIYICCMWNFFFVLSNWVRKKKLTFNFQCI